MKKIIFPLLLILGASVAYAQNFTLKSNDTEGQAKLKQVFNNFGCEGENISPQLSWVDPPKGTKSFAITMYDPDAPSGSGWWQWVAFDIPASSREFVENAGNVTEKLATKGTIQSLNNTLYALKTPTLGLQKDANPAMVGFYINANTIEKSSLVMYYQRTE